MEGELLTSSAGLGTQNPQGFKCRLEKSLEWRSKNLEHTGKFKEIKIAGKSSVQIFLDSYSPPACPLLLKSFLAPQMLWMLETCPMGYTSLCSEPLQGLPAINMCRRQTSSTSLPVAFMHPRDFSFGFTLFFSFSRYVFFCLES